MTRRYTSTIGSLVMLFWIVLASYGQTRDIASILNQFPGYHVLRLEDRNPDLKNFLGRHFPKSNGSVVHADFDGDGQQDYALLVRNDELGKAMLLILLCRADGTCKKVYDLDLSAYSSSIYVRSVLVGSRVSETAAVSTSNRAPVKLGWTGVRLTYYEQAQLVLFWNSKLRKIEELQTRD